MIKLKNKTLIEDLYKILNLRNNFYVENKNEKFTLTFEAVGDFNNKIRYFYSYKNEQDALHDYNEIIRIKKRLVA